MKNYITSALCISMTFMFLSDAFCIGSDFKGGPSIRTYSPKEYGAGMQNHQIAQDNRGIIYTANNYGLLEFDGSQWESYQVSNGTKLRTVAIHTNGRVYCGAQNQFGYFFPDDLGQMTYYSISDSLPDDQKQIGEVWKSFVIGDIVYFCTDHSIYKYDGKKVIRLLNQLDIRSSFVISNRLYFYQAGKGISFIENNKEVFMHGSEIFKDKLISVMLPLINSRLLISTEENGLYIYTGNKFAPWQVSSNDILKKVFIQTGLKTSNNTIAIGTRSNGIFLISEQGELQTVLDKKNGFNNKSILGLSEDEFGNLWVGQNNGLAKIEISSPFTYFHDQYEVEGAGYCSYFNNDGLYIGTNNGLYLLKPNKNNQLKDQYNIKKLTDGQVYSIQEFDNQLLIGHEDGATILKDNKIKVISDINGSWKYMIPTRVPNVMIEGNYHGLKTYQNIDKTWISNGQLDGLHESSRVFLEDVDGSIWMTHGYKGVYKIYMSKDYQKIDSVKFYDQSNGFATNRLINVFRINNEFIFCSGQGIYAYNSAEDRFDIHDKFTELFGENSHIREMQEDAQGNIYFIAASYSGVLIKDKFDNYSMSTKIFNKIHSKLNDDLEDISVITNNHILFGAHEGFIHYNPYKQTPLLNPINILIRNVTSTNDEKVLFAGNFHTNDKIEAQQPEESIIELEHKNNGLLFRFSSTFADDDKKTHYSYYLKGYESKWSKWTDNTMKEYTNLIEGEYEFLVRAKNIYETTSEPTSYKFIILTPWYRTTAAYFLYIIIVIGVVYIMLFTQNQVHKKEKKVLTLTQKRELIRKDNEMVHFSEKSNAEIIKLQNEKLELDINTKNKELASSTMNLIDKNQLLTGLKSDINTILESSKRNTSAKALKDMIKKIDKNIAHDDEWEHFQQYFDQVHGDFTNRLRDQFASLSPQEVKLCNYLRMSLSTKEIAQLMNITNRGVEIARYRLRKKLELSRETNLSEYIGRF